MALSQSEAKQLNEALLSAYNPNSLKRMLFFQLGKHLDQIAGPGNFLNVVFAVITTAEMEGWTNDLVHAAHDANPGNPKLKAFTDQYLRFKGSSQALEKVIHETNSFIDVSQWRTKLAQIERRVCSIEIAGDHEGTGFLIGADQVMTNYHVIEDLLGEAPVRLPEQVRVRFDFKKSADGNVLNDGVRYELVNDGWLIDSSPYSELDGKDTDEVPTLDELDYAVLRVAPRTLDGGKNVLPGNEPIKGSIDRERGWMTIPNNAFQFKEGQSLFIVQHPSGQPLKMALDTEGIQSVNSNRTRVKYTTNTEPGSSGSPCFNSNWDLIALHHVGDPNWENPEWNQGIPIDVIASRLGNKLMGIEDPEVDDTTVETPVITVDDEVDELLG